MQYRPLRFASHKVLPYVGVDDVRSDSLGHNAAEKPAVCLCEQRRAVQFERTRDDLARVCLGRDFCLRLDQCIQIKNLIVYVG